MTLSGDSWKRSVAYLKAVVPDDDPAPVMVVSGDDEPVLRDLHNGLLVTYLVDSGERFKYVQMGDLHAAGITADELHRLAIDNLYALAEQHLRVQPYGSVFAVFMEDNFEASVLLLDTVWDVSLADRVRGDFLAAAPSRDVLAFGDASSPAARRELRAIVDRVTASGADHPLSTSLLRRSGGAWTREDA